MYNKFLLFAYFLYLLPDVLTKSWTRGVAQVIESLLFDVLHSNPSPTKKKKKKRKVQDGRDCVCHVLLSSGALQGIN
jgi:hypothetical protein